MATKGKADEQHHKRGPTFLTRVKCGLTDPQRHQWSLIEMVQKLKADGFREFIEKINDIEAKKLTEVFILFSGSKDMNGESWCPDCVEAEPVIEEALQSAPEESIFLYVTVGDRNVWKNPNCEFRLDDRTKLTCIPTLLKWRTNRRLLDYQCKNRETVLMMFED